MTRAAPCTCGDCLTCEFVDARARGTAARLLDPEEALRRWLALDPDNDPDAAHDAAGDHL